MNVNIKTVAKRADVSIATVSRTLRNLPGVREKTRKKVLKAVSDLDYDVNAVASNLRLKETKTIGVIVGNVLSQFHSITAKAVEDTANKFGYNVILCNSDDDAEKELKYLKVLKSNRVDGIILISRGKNAKYINKLIDSGIKIVLLDRLINGVNCDAVISDNENSAYIAVKHIIDQGYKKIGIINGFLDITTDKDRLNGYLKALAEAGIPRDNSLIKIGGFKKEDGIDLSRELFKDSNKPEALFIANLDLTLGSILYIKKKGMKIPDEIGVVGFDDSEWALILDPPLTTVRQPVYNIGSTATDILIKRIKKDKSLTKEPLIITLNSTLIIRESTRKITR